MPFTRYQLIGIAACETALTGNQTITTEYVGLVSGFMRQGASCVLSTLWVVEDVSSTLLTIEFYRRFTAGMAPATALKQAQQWLRTVTYPELARWYRTRAQEIANYNSYRCEDLTDLAANIETDRAKMNSTQPPYADYYNWAGFVITGK
jgi:CHAT domain-containing protein